MLSKLLLSKFKVIRLKVTFWQAPTDAHITEVQNSCCNLKIKYLGTKMCVALLF